MVTVSEQQFVGHLLLTSEAFFSHQFVSSFFFHCRLSSEWGGQDYPLITRNRIKRASDQDQRSHSRRAGHYSQSQDRSVARTSWCVINDHMIRMYADINGSIWLVAADTGLIYWYIGLQVCSVSNTAWFRGTVISIQSWLVMKSWIVHVNVRFA